jgi:aspartyl-tRNA(Asn)/glutamyl-tRNA(Gln) amidotransferase subunit C
MLNMGLTSEDIHRVALLARLHVEDSDVAALTEQLSRMVKLVGELSELDTEGVEPMVHAFELSNVLEADQMAASLAREAVLQNAPLHDGECFRVPPVLG